MADDFAIGLGECRPSSVVATAQITVMGPIPSQSLRCRKCQSRYSLPLLYKANPWNALSGSK